MTSGRSLPEPAASTVDPAATCVEYLDFFRAEVTRKVSGLDQSQLRSIAVPSGWTPIALVEHLVQMERRWVVWGFLGEALTDPLNDRDADEKWVTERGLNTILADLAEVGRRTRSIVSSSRLTDHASPGGRYAEGEPTPTLLAILFHVLQEYARHAGHLDIARELIDGTTGEDWSTRQS